MKYFKILLILFSASTLQCQSNNEENMNWEIIDFSQIPGETFRDDYFEPITKYNFSEILTINKNHFILLGDNSGDRDENYLPKEKEAIVFVSLDGGKNLVKHNLGKGTLTNGVYVENTVFLINNTSKNGKLSSQLIKAHPLLKQWEIVNEFANECITGNTSFFSSNIAIANFGSRKPANQKYISEYKYTLDGGKNWIKVNDNNSNSNLTYFEFISSDKIEFIEHNQLITLNFITGKKTVVAKDIAPENYACNGLYKDAETNESYTYVINSKDEADWYVKYLNTQAIIQFPKELNRITISGNYMHSMVKDGTYYNYVWSNDKGKTWNTEKLRDFFVIPRPIGYYGRGYVYAFVTCFKGNKSEKGGRFAIRKL